MPFTYSLLHPQKRRLNISRTHQALRGRQASRRAAVEQLPPSSPEYRSRTERSAAQVLPDNLVPHHTTPTGRWTTLSSTGHSSRASQHRGQRRRTAPRVRTACVVRVQVHPDLLKHVLSHELICSHRALCEVLSDPLQLRQVCLVW